jgi:hypothetical protein
MNKQKYTWDEYPGELLRYGRPCRAHQHQDAAGFSLRMQNGRCLACMYGRAPGLFEHNFTGVTPMKVARKYASADEARQAHVERQKLWNRNNPDKFQAAQEKYRTSEKFQEKAKLRYQNMTEEQREKSRQRQREYYVRVTKERNKQRKDPK